MHIEMSRVYDMFLRCTRSFLVCHHMEINPSAYSTCGTLALQRERIRNERPGFSPSSYRETLENISASHWTLFSAQPQYQRRERYELQHAQQHIVHYYYYRPASVTIVMYATVILREWKNETWTNIILRTRRWPSTYGWFYSLVTITFLIPYRKIHTSCVSMHSEPIRISKRVTPTCATVSVGLMSQTGAIIVHANLFAYTVTTIACFP